MYSLGSTSLSAGLSPLDGDHGVIHGSADGRLMRLGLELGPSGLGRHPEDVLGDVLVRVFGIRAFANLSLQLGVGFLKGVGDILQEDETQDDVLVLGGVHTAPQGVGHAPVLGLVVRVDGIV